MRITTNAVYQNLVNQMSTANKQQVKYQDQIATGQRIDTASDDPAAMARIVGMRSEKTELTQYERNIRSIETTAQVTFEGIRGIQELALSAEEIASKSNDLMGVDGFAAYAEQVNQIIEQVIDTGNAKHLGNYLHSGDATDTEPYQVDTRDANGWITAMNAWAGSTTEPEAYIAPATKVPTLADDGVNQEIHSLITNLMALRDGLSAQNMTDVATARTNLQNNEHEMVKAMSNIGGRLSRLELARDMNATRFNSLEEGISRDADADIALAITNLNRSQLAYEAAMQSGSRLMRTSLLDFI